MVAPVFWNLDPPKMDGGGRIVEGGMFEHQREWWDKENFIRLLVTGYGGGKTFLLCKRMISLALLNAPVPVALVSPTFPMARQTTIRTTAELLAGKESLDRSFSWTHNATAHEFHIRHGKRVGTIIIYSGEHPERLKGPNLAAAGIDEPFIQDKEVFTQMIARVRHPRAVKLEINLTGTPEQLNWGYDLAEGDLKDQHDVGVVHASTRANLALDTAYVDRLEASLDDKAVAAYVNGEFTNLSKGLVFHAFDPGIHVKDMAAPDDAVWACGMDFNVSPMAFVVFWHTKKHMHIVREYQIPNSDTQDACIVIRDDYPDVVECYPDPSCRDRSTTSPGGKTDAYYIRKAGFQLNAPGSHWPLRDSYNAVNGAFKAGKLSISPTCRDLKKFLLTYSWELQHKQSHKDMKHLLDSMRYPTTYLFPVMHARATSKVMF